MEIWIFHFNFSSSSHNLLQRPKAQRRFIMWKSNVHPWVRVAGIAGASAVAMGAIGAHALTKSSETMRDIWRVSHNTIYIYIYQTKKS